MKTKTKTRYSLIDALRGFALANMLVYHFMYDVNVIFGFEPKWFTLPGVIAWGRFICFSFILIAGISLNFSRRSYLRGIIVNACGLLLTLVTVIVIPQQAIWFGVLNLIGCSLLIGQLCRPLLEKINPYLGAAVSILLFAFTYKFPVRRLGFFEIKLVQLPGELYFTDWLSPFGFPSDTFFSSDYFPLIPWLFLFLCGFFIWRAILALRLDRFFLLKIPVLDQLGRYSLWIYLAHQPLLFAVCALLFNGRCL